VSGVSEHKGVWVYSESNDLAMEMLGKGRELADKLQTELAAIVIGNNVQDKANDLAKYGADKVHVADNASLERFQAESYLAILQNLATTYRPEIVMIGSTRNGKPLAARLATKLETGCVPDCTRLSVDENRRLIGERITYGGNAIARITFKTKPQIVTVPSRAFEKPETKDHHGQVVKHEFKVEQPRTEVVDRKPLEMSSVRIEEAQYIVSGGRGIERKDDIALLEALAKVLNGQVGCSRPLVEDRKWFTDWIGLSGHKVKPKLYIAVGVSGVIQHVAGIRDSKVIVAINKDPEAPIFEVSDYGVVGNLYEVVPALTDALKKALQ
jgi:electron transfer flavoprotein alpha subunit